MRDMLSRWWAGPVLFAGVAAPVAGIVVMLIALAESLRSGEPLHPMMLLALPPFLGLFALMALGVGLPAVLLGGAVAGVLARGRMGDGPYIALMAAWAAALALAGYRLDLFHLAQGDAFILPDAWRFALGWAAGAAGVCGLLRWGGRPSPGAGT